MKSPQQIKKEENQKTQNKSMAEFGSTIKPIQKPIKKPDKSTQTELKGGIIK